ncbi:MAG: cysteine desulfurase [Alphaproteobacteria bacterium]|nr:cysteine desulfurase [Alphaproteobacteria bacterium]
MNRQPIYLDYNATAKLYPEVRETVLRLLDTPHNASSVHTFGRTGRKEIEKARERVAALACMPAGQVIFNSGATEGNNTVLSHFKGQRVLISAVEHSSVLQAAPQAERVPVTPDGLLDLTALEALLRQETRPALLSVMLVNNEMGVIQPVREAAALAKKYGALVHCDAVQAAGRIKLDMQELGADFLTLSAHKIGGPQGAGALVLGLCGNTPVLLHGGGQEKGARAGTENVAAIAGFGTAAEQALSGLEHFAALGKLRDKVEQALGSMGEITIYGASAPRVANTSLFSLPGRPSETMQMALDLEGIAVSAGAACSSGSARPSTVLSAMGVPEKEARTALRVSLGWATSQEEIERFLEIFEKIYKRMG